jgi:hypothetical protein
MGTRIRLELTFTGELVSIPPGRFDDRYVAVLALPNEYIAFLLCSYH